MSAGSQEFCMVDAAGNRDDATLHGYILDGAASSEDTIILATRNRLIAAGEDADLMKRLYPISTDGSAA